MSTNMTIEGIPETIRATGAEEVLLLDDLREIVRKNTTALVRKSKAAAPIGPTGNLKRSIGQRDVSRKVGNLPKLSKTVTPRSKKGGWHKAIVSKGTRERIQHRTGRRTGSSPANPFMERAAQAQTIPYQAEIRARIARERVI